MDTYNFILVIADSFRTSLKEDKAPDIIAQPPSLTRTPPVLTSQLMGITCTILLAFNLRSERVLICFPFARVLVQPGPVDDAYTRDEIGDRRK
jgi:hypothetical protein